MAVAQQTDLAPVKPPDTPALTGCEAVRAEASKYSDWDINTITAIATSESRYHQCIPTEHNLTASETHRRFDGSVICIGSYGALQVGCLHYSPDDNRDDLATNVRIAYKVWQSSGYTAWTEYRNGNYREYLK